MGLFGQNLSLCFITLINIYFSFISRWEAFIERTLSKVLSSIEWKWGEKKMPQETWMSSCGSSKFHPESQSACSNSCLQPPYPCYTLDQRSIDRTRSKKKGNPRCLALDTSSNATAISLKIKQSGKATAFLSIYTLLSHSSCLLPWCSLPLPRDTI